MNFVNRKKKPNLKQSRCDSPCSDCHKRFKPEETRIATACGLILCVPCFEKRFGKLEDE